ncbi:glycosyltransferase [Francisella philomiragia]|uniref:glycosyltransferase n=1 Tax=Francisella philomiragia TaxID=28110 RepID=UPI003519BF4D
MSKKKILVISWHFLPFKSSSAFNLFKRIKDTGYEYDVIQIARDRAFAANEKMFRFAKSKFNRYEVTVPSENSRDENNREVFTQSVIDKVKELIKTNHYSAILSHSHETASHIAALEVKKVLPSVPWIASFGDPIATNPYNDSYKYAMLKEDCEYEKQVLRAADRVVVTNEYQKKIVLANDPEVDADKFSILPHCYDIDMYQASKVENQKFRFMHIGMLYKFKRTSEPFIKAVEALINKYPKYRDMFTVEFYGAKDKFIDSAMQSDSLQDIVKYSGAVDYLTSLTIMTESDCLLLRDADFSDIGLGYSPFYPGKLADYFGARKPMIAVTMRHGCVPDIFSDLNLPSLVESDIDSIVDAMKKAIDGKLKLNDKSLDFYSAENGAIRAKQIFTFSDIKRKIVVAGHDLKFAKFIIEDLENDPNVDLYIDKWQSHEKHDVEQSSKLLDTADVIFCEWGLGNIVWYSQHKKQGQKLVVRVHAQELRTRHLDKVNHENVDNYIFVAPYYYELMIKEFSLDRSKCLMIYNFVDTRLLDKPKKEGYKYHLGMIGDVPQSKRLDIALDIFEKLYQKDKRYKLFIKGKRPEDYKWMHSKAKKPEMDFYKAQYKRIKDNGWDNNVIFEGHGPIDEWLQNIGYIISTSDHESFHLSVAEGMASGAIPVIRNWKGANSIYPSEFIYSDCCDAINIVINNNYINSGVKTISKKFSISNVLVLTKYLM